MQAIAPARLSAVSRIAFYSKPVFDYFLATTRDRKVEKKIPASLGKNRLIGKEKRSTVITASCTDIE